MRKIANSGELQHELRKILAYAGSQRPSRVALAESLTDLSRRVAMEFPTQKALETYLKKHPKADKAKHSVQRSEAEHQSSEEYKTSKREDYYPQKPPAGLEYPKELDGLGKLKDEVMSMYTEDFDKNRSYKQPSVKKLQKSLRKRLKNDDNEWDEVAKEMVQLSDLKEKMSEKMRNSKSDAEADPYRFAMRKLYHAWQGYNAAIQEYQHGKRSGR